MMKYSVRCLAVAAIVAAGAASAQSSGPTIATPEDTTVTAPRAQPKKDKKVCRERMRSGSHLTNIVCKTPEQWAQLQEQLDTEAEYGIPGNKVSSGRAINTGTGGGGPPR
jgi:hypothetical protein